MPTADQHRRKAEKNRLFLAAIPLDDHPEWAATVAFYTAVHRVEELRRSAGDGDSAGHTDRLEYVSVVHPPIIDAMQELHTVAHVARYESTSRFFARYDTAFVRDVVIAGCLAAVEAYVATQTAAPPEAPA